MTEPPRIVDLRKALDDRLLPTIGLWNRLEGRPRTTDFDRALRAEVRDPLWLLSRQWQLGEFRASDGGSPATATYRVSTTSPSRFRPAAGVAQPLPTDRPLEAVAERRAVPFAFGVDPISYDLRLSIGRRWLKLLGQSLLLRIYRTAYVTAFAIPLPDPNSDTDTPRVAHPDVWATMQAVAGRRMDGYRLYQQIKAGRNAYDGVDGVLFLHFDALNELGARLVSWFETLIDQPTAGAAWDPRRLEHRFSVSAARPGAETVLTAPEYPGGELDWHAFSTDPDATLGASGPTPEPIHRTVFPTPVRFSGMPLPRWWAIEDGRTNFAAVRPDSTDLARLIFLEFALIYSNDWFLLPCDLPAGRLASVQGLVVTDVFGQRLWITPAGADDQDRRHWSMFTLDTVTHGPAAAGTGLFLAASVPKVANGPALEEVSLIRDENANMVWGVERTVRLPTGDSRRGDEVTADILAHRTRLHPPLTPTDPRAPVAYQAMSAVPEHWIPFIPVHVTGQNRAIQLRRGAIPTGVDQRPTIQPRTALLREGLDTRPVQPYHLDEEQVQQAGTTVTVAYNRTRWYDGRVVVWLSTRRGTGRGAGASGLAFDTAVGTAPSAGS